MPRVLPVGYEAIRVLGAGGFGEVLLARHLALDRLVAVKRIHAQALAGPEAIERFRREALVLASLKHPAVVRVYDFRRDADDAVLVMEYVEGQSLGDLVDEGPLPVAAALKALRDVAEALAAGAAQGIAHRDVKPANVFVLPDGHAKLGDFGLARVAADPSVFRTSDGSSIGTPAYFPPETGQGLSEPDERSDAYSFAVMAFEVLTGRLPYEGLGAVAMIAAHWSQEPPAPTELVPGFPHAASEALLEGLAKDPSKRPLPVDLMRRLAAVPASTWPVPAARSPGRAPATVLGAAPPVRTAEVPALKGKRFPWRVLVLGLSVAVAVIVAVLSRRPGPAAPLQVTGGRVTVSPATGQCPRAVFVLTAQLTTNGSEGPISAAWRGLDGRLGAPITLRARQGRADISTTLSVTVTGARPLSARATLEVTSPTVRHLTSPPVLYSC